MAVKPRFSSPLEAALAKLKKQEKSPWGKLQNWSHRGLARLEGNSFLRNYGSFLKRAYAIPSARSEPALDLDSFLVVSLFFHLLVFFLLTTITFSTATFEKTDPIQVLVMDLGTLPPIEKEKAKKEPRPARTQPRVTATRPAAAETKPPATAPAPAPSLPAPKSLAELPQERLSGLTAQPAESLVQLPTRSPEAEISAGTKVDSLPGPRTIGKIEAQLLDKEEGSARASLSRPDIAQYLEKIKKRVQSFWQYPEGIAGKHLVYLSFVLGRGGNLVRVKVLESTDPRLVQSATEAMRQASPFPAATAADTAVLKEIAGDEIGIRFHIDFGVKVAR